MTTAATTPWTKLVALLKKKRNAQDAKDGSVPIGCRFVVVKSSARTLFSLFSTHREASPSVLFLSVNAGTIAIQDDTQDVETDIADVHVELKGKKQIELVLQREGGCVMATYGLEHRVQAIECIGTIHFMQHAAYLQTTKRSQFSNVFHDSILVTHMQHTIDFASEMWTSAMWNVLYPYSRISDVLRDAQSALVATDVRQAVLHLNALLDEFYALASFSDESDAPRHLHASYLTLLLAKIKALEVHIELYIV
ncbi:unnamed protein product [Aphanomyces euteiches]